MCKIGESIIIVDTKSHLCVLARRHNQAALVLLRNSITMSQLSTLFFTFCDGGFSSWVELQFTITHVDIY